MMNDSDRSTPVTRGALREDLAQLRQQLELWTSTLLARIASGEQRLFDRIDHLEHHIDHLEVRIGQTEHRIGQTELRLMMEFARHAAVHESLSGRLAGVGETCIELSDRVGWLEVHATQDELDPREG